MTRTVRSIVRSSTCCPARILSSKDRPEQASRQTITNIIAAALAEGKSVLFISEKLAALEVVKKRLALAGLANFCLELHSNKTQKKHVLEELEKRRDANFSAPLWLSSKLKTLEEKRKHLAAYADLLNGVHGNACALTVHQVLWRAERYRQKCGDGWEATQELILQTPPHPTRPPSVPWPTRSAEWRISIARLAVTAPNTRTGGLWSKNCCRARTCR